MYVSSHWMETTREEGTSNTTGRKWGCDICRYNSQKKTKRKKYGTQKLKSKLITNILQHQRLGREMMQKQQKIKQGDELNGGVGNGNPTQSDAS